VTVQLYSGFDNGKKIVFRLDTAVRSIANDVGDVVWLKIERNLHQLKAWYSGDDKNWIQVGAPVNASILDRMQPNFNSWVGTSIGLFAEGKPADFDLFICKDGFSVLPAAGYSNFYGIKKEGLDDLLPVTSISAYGGWLMIAGVDLGQKGNAAGQVELLVSSRKKANIEIWLDDLKEGRLIATVPVEATGKKWKTFRKSVKNISGHHDVFVKFPPGSANELLIKSIQFFRTK